MKIDGNDISFQIRKFDEGEPSYDPYYDTWSSLDLRPET